MPFDTGRLLSRPPLITRQVLARRDTILYALGVGASELQFVYEENLEALATMPAILGNPGFFWRDPELGVDWKRVLHGEQSVEIHAPLPVEGDILGKTVIESLIDKGPDKGAIAYIRRDVSDATGKQLATVRSASVLRGNGGFGGSSSSGPKPHSPPPERAADSNLSLPTAPNQALIYRLCGDYNPLHIDPAVARAANFSTPILHGLCTYGVAGRALMAALCGNEPARIKRIDVRFSSPVYPGETIVTEIWREGAGQATFRASVAERNLLVLNNGYAEFK